MSTAATFKPRCSAVVERKDPRFVQFEAGDFVDGILLSIERITVDGGPVSRYTLEDENGEAVAFLGTAQINQKIRTQDMGCGVSVCCTGRDERAGKRGNAMKLFFVGVTPWPAKWNEKRTDFVPLDDLAA